MPTKNQSTLDEYKRVQERIFLKIQKKGDIPSPDAVVDYIESLVPERGYSWLRKVKASLVNYYTESNLVSAALAVDAISSENSKRKNLGTSAAKRKFIKASEVDTLRKFFDVNMSEFKSAKPLLAVMEATLITGLRPSEWEKSFIATTSTEVEFNTPEEFEYTGQYPALIVKNGKATNGRSFGEYRGLGLENVSQKGMIFIKLAIAYSSGKGLENFDWFSFYDQIRVLLNNIVNRKLPKC